MEDAGPACWIPDHTWRLFARPMLLALGWGLENSKGRRCLAGCRLFAGSVRDSREQPALVVHVTSLGSSLAEAASWVETCVGAGPRRVKGASVLADGGEWRIYDLSKPGLGGRLVCCLSVLEGSRTRAARLLHEWAGRSVFT